MPGQTPFSVKFKNEEAVDQGGPYSDSISQICKELQSHVLPLLIKSPNQAHHIGLFREKWILNPDSTSHIHLQMYEFLGLFFGLAIRTNHYLGLHLPSLLWKQLLGIEPTITDLQYIDQHQVQWIEYISNLDLKNVDESNLEEKNWFVVYLSNGKEVELIENGK